MDGVLCDYAARHAEVKAAQPDIDYPQSRYGFFANLDPIEGAIEGVKALIASPDFDPYILTAPSYINPLCYTEKRVWIEKYLGLKFCRRIIISSHKNFLQGDYLIDDRSSGHGQDQFGGELILFGSKCFPNWDHVLDYLAVGVSTVSAGGGPGF